MSDKSKTEISIELIRALAWPTIVVILLISFWAPLQKTAKLLPILIDRSDTITIAGLTIKVKESLRKQASPEVEIVLSKLDRVGIEQVLEMGESTWWDIDDSEYGRSKTVELISLGLLEEVSDGEIKENNLRRGNSHGYAVKQTALGLETQEFLQAVVTEFVQELGSHSIK